MDIRNNQFPRNPNLQRKHSLWRQRVAFHVKSAPFLLCPIRDSLRHLLTMRGHAPFYPWPLCRNIEIGINVNRLNKKTKVRRVKKTKSRGKKNIYKQEHLPFFVSSFIVAAGISVAISVLGTGVKIAIIRISMLATVTMVFGAAVNTVGRRCRRCWQRRIAASATAMLVFDTAVHVVVSEIPIRPFRRQKVASVTMAMTSHLVMVPASAVPVHIDGRRLIIFPAAHLFWSPAPPLLEGSRYWKLPLNKKFGDGILASVSICLLRRPYFWRLCHGEDESMLLLLLIS